MGKYFPASARHAKALEFLELKQGTIIMLEYAAKFTKLARFADDYVTIDMAKVRKFEDGLKLSIRGKIMGFLLQDMDLMVKTTIAIEREVGDTKRIRDAGVKDKRREIQLLLLAQGRSRGLLLRKGFKDRAKARVNHPRVGETLGLLASQGRGYVSIATSLDT